jgi:hypothetical protein
MRVRFTNLSAATASDFVTLAYTSGCGIGFVASKQLSNIAPIGILASLAPASITASIVDTSVCGQRRIRFSIPTSPIITSYNWSIPTAKGAIIDSGAWSPSYKSASVACGRTIVVRFSNGSQFNGYPVTLNNRDSVSAVILGNTISGCFTGYAASRVLIPKLAYCNQVFSKTRPNPMDLSKRKWDVLIYPNPTTNNFKLQVISEGKGDVVIQVLDIQGRLLKTLKGQPNQMLSIGSDLKAGTYLIEVQQGQNVKITKMLKL